MISDPKCSVRLVCDIFFNFYFFFKFNDHNFSKWKKVFVLSIKRKIMKKIKFENAFITLVFKLLCFFFLSFFYFVFISFVFFLFNMKYDL